MLDTHSHIIYGLDDGSKGRDMTIAMLHRAEASGTTHIFATPHVLDPKERPSWDQVQSCVEELRCLAQDQGLGLKIYPGAETFMDWDLLEHLGSNGAYCYNGGSYILVELPQMLLPSYADDFFFELRLKGLRPVLAHPERYPYLYEGGEKDLKTLLRWRSEGLYLQANAGSLWGLYGSRAKENAHRLLKMELLDFIGSDAHRDQGRTTDMSRALEAMVQAGAGKEYIQALLQDNGKHLIENTELPLRPVKMPKKSLWQRLFG